ncbi:hypothetical protein B0H11DRAFT_1873230 [Mycena galericulata]|nr:hypothetical protein B0H11DRAFT_1873230 [Mycena galericulata]
MSGLFVIVDDQDAGILFSPGWAPTTAATAFEYGATITGPGPQGSTASYSFNGTSISVFARIAPNSQNTPTTISFVLDSGPESLVVIAANSTEHFHHQLFASPALPTGAHTLEITLAEITSNDVFLDYFIYEASLNSTVDSSARLLIPNTSPSLAFSQGWSPGIVLRPDLTKTAVSLNSSVAGAADLGATVALNFTGSGIEVHGLLLTQFPSPVASYSLDGASPVGVQMPPNGTSYTDAASNFEFIGQTFDEVGTHSLVITPLIPGAFYLDYMIVQSPVAFLPPRADVAVAPTASTSSASLRATMGAAPTNSGTPLTHTGQRALHTGAIVGITIGVIAAFLSLAFLAWLRRRRTRARTDDVTPYTVPTVAEAVSKEDRRGMRASAGQATLPPAYSAQQILPVSRRATLNV